MSLEKTIATVKQTSHAVIVALQYPELTTDAHVQQLNETTMPLISDHKKTNLILDFSRVNFISSSLLGYLLKLKDQLQKQKGQLILTGLNTKVKTTPNDKYINELFKVVKLNTVFKIQENINLALKSLS